MSQPSRMFGEPTGDVVLSAGYPDDGGDYTRVEPMSDTAGRRLVWFHRGHVWGVATTDPIPGSHLPTEQTAGWTVAQRAETYVYAAPDVGQPPLVLVPIRLAWLVGSRRGRASA